MDGFTGPDDIRVKTYDFVNKDVSAARQHDGGVKFFYPTTGTCGGYAYPGGWDKYHEPVTIEEKLAHALAWRTVRRIELKDELERLNSEIGNLLDTRKILGLEKVIH